MNATLLHKAVLGGDAGIVKLLLEGKADPLARSASGNTALDLAVQDGMTEIADVIAAAAKRPVPELPSISGVYLDQPAPGVWPGCSRRGLSPPNEPNSTPSSLRTGGSSISRSAARPAAGLSWRWRFETASGAGLVRRPSPVAGATSICSSPQTAAACSSAPTDR